MADMKPKYRYVMDVEETVKYTTTIVSDRKLTSRQLETIAENRRVKGELSMTGVSDVGIWINSAYKDGHVADPELTVRKGREDED